MQIKELHKDIERYLLHDCYCPHEIYSFDGFGYQLFYENQECEKIGDKYRGNEGIVGCIAYPYTNYCQEMKIKELQSKIDELQKSIENFKERLRKIGLKKELINLIIEEGFPPDDVSIIDNPNFIGDPLTNESYLIIKYDLIQMIDYLEMKGK